MYTYVYNLCIEDIYIYTYDDTCLCMSEMNNMTDTKDAKKQLILFYYYKILILPLRYYSII